MRRFIRCCPLMLVCLLFIGSIAAVGYVSLLLPDKLVLTRSLLITAGGVTAAADLSCVPYPAGERAEPL